MKRPSLSPGWTLDAASQDDQAVTPASAPIRLRSRSRPAGFALTACALFALCCASTALPQTPATDRLDPTIRGYELDTFVRTSIGVTRQGTPIPALVTADDFDLEVDKTRVLLIGGLDGKDDSVDAALGALEWFQNEFRAHELRKKYLVSAVPCANPEGYLKDAAENGSGGDPTIGYPPSSKAYNDPKNPEAQYLWRWIGMFAPDFVIDLREGERHELRSNQTDTGRISQIISRVASKRILQEDELASALCGEAACETGVIPAIQVACGEHDGGYLLNDVLKRIERANMAIPSPARIELRNRVARSPQRVALQLAENYGKQLKQVAYQPALALVARARLTELTGDATQLKMVREIVEPYLSGEKPSFGKRVYGSHYSGHLIFGELARTTGHEGYSKLVKAAADHGFNPDGSLKEAMPTHNEMSDAVFMSCPILAQAGALTGDDKYFEMCLKHLKFMQKHCLRKDGIYRHSPLDEAAWGRGNGFPALGLAWTLSWMPDEFDGRYEILSAYRAHMSALAGRQDPNGMWHQVIDRPESYRELTSTCMITFAMIRGIRNNWLNPEGFQPVVERAWNALKTRIPANGRLVDVCTGTGKQKNLRAYYDRTAILGPDERGGAMAFMVATEMAAWLKEQQN